MTIRIFNLDFESVSEAEAAALVIEAATMRIKGLIVTPNVDHIVTLPSDAEMATVFTNALYRFADGMPIVWFSRLLGKGLPARVTGSDLLPNVAALAAKSGQRLFLLGGRPQAAEKAACILMTRNPGLQISGTYCPDWGFESNINESTKIIDFINACNTDILFIGVGTPKQEKWAAKYITQMNVGPIIGVGAAFDFAAGFIHRPPKWMQKFGLEWLGRLLSEPRRLWRRYLLKDAKFFRLAFNEFLKQRRMS